MKERRMMDDRRRYTKPRAGTGERSRFPDRRLSNITVEWIPMGLVHSHPLTSRVFKSASRLLSIN